MQKAMDAAWKAEVIDLDYPIYVRFLSNQINKGVSSNQPEEAPKHDIILNTDGKE